MKTTHIMDTSRSAGDVKRYSGWPTLRQQTNAHHTWNVMRIFVEVFGPPTGEVFHYMLHHDSGELRAGDVAHHVKAANPDLKRFMDAAEVKGRADLGIHLPDLSALDLWRFKVADLLEMAEFAAEEQEMGNARMQPVTNNIEWALFNHLDRGYAASSEADAEERVLWIKAATRTEAWVRYFNNRCEHGGRARRLILDGADRR